MPVPSTIADLSTTASANSPQGSESIGISIDDYIRTCFAFVKQISDRPSGVDTSSLAPKTGEGTSGTWPISITGHSATATSAVNGGVTSVNGLTGAVSIASGVTSVNGGVGAISAAQIAAAAVAAWGYTPPNPSGLNADTLDGYHYNNLPYLSSNSYGAIGAFALLSPASSVSAGLTSANNSWMKITSSGVPSSLGSSTGTWRNMAGSSLLAGDVGLFQRVA